MPAWNKEGQSVDHPEPWGRNGSFSTLRVYPGCLLPFRRDYLGIDGQVMTRMPTGQQRRHPDRRDGRVDMLLDTLCNTFGGIILIAVLLALSVNKKSVELYEKLVKTDDKKS